MQLRSRFERSSKEHPTSSAAWEQGGGTHTFQPDPVARRSWKGRVPRVRPAPLSTRRGPPCSAPSPPDPSGMTARPRVGPQMGTGHALALQDKSEAPVVRRLVKCHRPQGCLQSAEASRLFQIQKCSLRDGSYPVSTALRGVSGYVKSG
ncbi:unnamed protein product, partial [Ixodes pacificus]